MADTSSRCRFNRCPVQRRSGFRAAACANVAVGVCVNAAAPPRTPSGFQRGAASEFILDYGSARSVLRLVTSDQCLAPAFVNSARCVGALSNVLVSSPRWSVARTTRVPGPLTRSVHAARCR
jgi:hypothetical protein